MIIPFFKYTDDAHLVKALKVGNEGAIKYILFGKYEGVLRNLAQNVTRGKPIEFDDMRQDFYIFLSNNNWEILQKYNPEEKKFMPWLYRVAFNFFRNYARKGAYTKIDCTDDVTLYEKDRLERWYDSDLMRDLLRVLPSVKPERDRVVIEAVVLNDEEPEEIAKKLGVTVDNFYNIKRRALFNLISNYLTGYEEYVQWKNTSKK